MVGGGTQTRSLRRRGAVGTLPSIRRIAIHLLDLPSIAVAVPVGLAATAAVAIGLAVVAVTAKVVGPGWDEDVFDEVFGYRAVGGVARSDDGVGDDLRVGVQTAMWPL